MLEDASISSPCDFCYGHLPYQNPPVQFAARTFAISFVLRPGGVRLVFTTDLSRFRTLASQRRGSLTLSQCEKRLSLHEVKDDHQGVASETERLCNERAEVYHVAAPLSHTWIARAQGKADCQRVARPSSLARSYLLGVSGDYFPFAADGWKSLSKAGS